MVETNGDLLGIKLSRIAPSVYYLMYANNLIIVCRVDLKNTEAVANTLNNYCGWSGQLINEDESHVVIYKNTPRELRKSS